MSVQSPSNVPLVVAPIQAQPSAPPPPKVLTKLDEIVDLLKIYGKNFSWATGGACIWYAYNKYRVISQPAELVKDFLLPMLSYSAAYTAVVTIDKMAKLVIGQRPLENKAKNASNSLGTIVWKVIITTEDTADKVDRAFSNSLGIRSYRQLNLAKVPHEDLSFLEITRQATLNTLAENMISLVAGYFALQIINRVGFRLADNLFSILKTTSQSGGLKELFLFQIKNLVPVFCLFSANVHPMLYPLLKAGVVKDISHYLALTMGLTILQRMTDAGNEKMLRDQKKQEAATQEIAEQKRLITSKKPNSLVGNIGKSYFLY